MADCPGVLHLAEMADGGLARIRTPGGRLTGHQARAVADLAEQLGSGVIDLTNRANLQIRGLSLDAGAALAEGLFAAGLFVDGPADRRRNILLDPLAGLDPTEVFDLRGVSEDLERALTAAPWIADLSPKFSFALDGGGRSRISATASDVGFLAVSHCPQPSWPGLALDVGCSRLPALKAATREYPSCRPSTHSSPSLDAQCVDTRAKPGHDGDVAVSLASRLLGVTVSSAHLVEAALAIARMAADAGSDARGRDLSHAAIVEALLAAGLARPAELGHWPSAVAPAFGIVATADPAHVAVAVPVAVGRLDPTALRWLADAAERHGDGTLVLAPWSAVVVPGVATGDAMELLARSERAGFPPVAVVERLTVIACAGAPACVRAREPAKAIGLALLAAAAERPDRLPPAPRSVHVSACAKGCAGSAPADLLLLGASGRGRVFPSCRRCAAEPGQGYRAGDEGRPAGGACAVGGRISSGTRCCVLRDARLRRAPQHEDCQGRQRTVRMPKQKTSSC